MTVLTETMTLNNDILIPQVGFGTWQIPDGDVAYQAVSAALAAGYRHIDTAYVYGNERSVGQAIKDSGIPRSELFVTSKLPAEVKDPTAVRDYFDQTLANLGLDYLDLYLIHAPWPWREAGTRYDKANTAVWQQLEELYEGGAARAIGVSNFDVHDLQNLLDTTTVVPAVDQIQYYIGFTEPKITAFAKAHGILIEAYSPLATGGLLQNPAVAGIAAHYGVTTSQLALRYVLQTGALPLPKATSKAHIEANTQLAFTISAKDMAALDAMPDAAAGKSHNPTQG
ncbi:aldo/keto reductase [Lacticaseibacillus parakribbianus]|uniref:aldo/keto reductase n=1 Tax=Lacticaseibacillus parakribbianus TaxID=2970927 RepID=UPI0021CB7EF6|nr:aldo/keto reductase [Lacticaseibacillus parakribbianus]